jgi:transposase
MGFRKGQGGYTAVTDTLRDLRPAPLPGFEVRFETPPGEQAQVDFAQFQVVFTDEPAVTRIVWRSPPSSDYGREHHRRGAASASV